MRSTITIDGLTLNGSALEITALANAVTSALDRLDEDPSHRGWVPVMGNTDRDQRTVQAVRLRRESAISYTIVDDGTMPEEFYESMADTANAFVEKGHPAAES